MNVANTGLQNTAPAIRPMAGIEKDEYISRISSGHQETEASILCVTDNEETLSFFKDILCSKNLPVIYCSSKDEAIEHLKEEEISIFLCDENLSEQGCLRTLREAYDLRKETIKIIFGHSNENKSVVDAVNIGHIWQYISKPWNRSIIDHVIDSALEQIALLKRQQVFKDLLFSQHQDIAKAHKNLHKELQLAARIHEILLISPTPPGNSDINIAATTVASKEVDGDFYDFYHPTPAILDVVIGDVMGKGLPAAFVGTATKAQFARFAQPTSNTLSFTQKMLWTGLVPQLDQILENVGKELTRPLIELDFFVSLIYGRFDLNKGRFAYVDCGSAKPLHYRHASKEVFLLQGDNFPIGVAYEKQYNVVEVPFNVGDLFVFYSDGVTETKALDGEKFGLNALKSVITKYHENEPEELLDIVKQQIRNFSSNNFFDDDLTLIIVKITDNKLLSHNVLREKEFVSSLDELLEMRNFIKETCAEATTNCKRLSEHMQLSINEAFCNIVMHGYEGRESERVLISAQYDEEGVLFEIQDQGLAFNPIDVPDPEIENRPEGGYGIYIMKQLVDEISYTPKSEEGGWNRLHLFKRYIDIEGSMEITHEVNNDVIVVKLDGEFLDAKEASAFKEKVFDVLSKETHNKCIFNMGSLQFVDSSGLGTFLSILRKLNSQGGDLKLTHVTDPVRTLFQVVRMHKLFEIYHSVEDAIESFNTNK
jgi:anti-anti-sigma factor